VHLVGYIIIIYHDARSPERQFGYISCEAGPGSAYYSSINVIESLGFVSRALAGVFSLHIRRGQTVFLCYVIVQVVESGYRSLEFDKSFLFLSVCFFRFSAPSLFLQMIKPQVLGLVRTFNTQTKF